MMRFWMKALAGAGLALASAAPAQAAWWQAQTRHFTVYSEGKDETLRGFAEPVSYTHLTLPTTPYV